MCVHPPTAPPHRTSECPGILSVFSAYGLFSLRETQRPLTSAVEGRNPFDVQPSLHHLPRGSSEAPAAPADGQCKSKYSKIYETEQRANRGQGEAQQCSHQHSQARRRAWKASEKASVLRMERRERQAARREMVFCWCHGDRGSDTAGSVGGSVPTRNQCQETSLAFCLPGPSLPSPAHESAEHTCSGEVSFAATSSPAVISSSPPKLSRVRPGCETAAGDAGCVLVTQH